MDIAIARIAQPQEDAQTSRSHTRPAAQRRGQISSAQESALVMIGEASPHGCCVQCASGWLRRGQFVRIAIEDGAPVQAIVRWVRGDRAGLDFVHAIPPERRDWRVLIALNA